MSIYKINIFIEIPRTKRSNVLRQRKCPNKQITKKKNETKEINLEIQNQYILPNKAIKNKSLMYTFMSLGMNYNLSCLPFFYNISKKNRKSPPSNIMLN